MPLIMLKMLFGGLPGMGRNIRRGSGSTVARPAGNQLAVMPDSVTMSANTADTNRDRNRDLEGQRDGNAGQTSENAEAIHQKFFHRNPRIIPDAIIGLSDGLTVPFALTAGLSSLGDAHLVKVGGFAEIIAGAISMALGGFLAARSEAQAYNTLVGETQGLVRNSETETANIVNGILQQFRVIDATVANRSQILHGNQDELVNFIMVFHHHTAKPTLSRPFISAVVIGSAYFVGGIIPLLPYICVSKNEVFLALHWSIGIVAVTLFIFGWSKTCVDCGWQGKKNVRAGFKGAIEMVIMGGCAAAAAYGIVLAINRHHDA